MVLDRLGNVLAVALFVELVDEPLLDADLALQPVGRHHPNLRLIALGPQLLDLLRDPISVAQRRVEDDVLVAFDGTRTELVRPCLRVLVGAARPGERVLLSELPGKGVEPTQFVGIDGDDVTAEFPADAPVQSALAGARLAAEEDDPGVLMGCQPIQPRTRQDLGLEDPGMFFRAEDVPGTAHRNASLWCSK